MKKLLCLLLSLILLCSFVACAGSGPDETTGEPKTEAPETTAPETEAPESTPSEGSTGPETSLPDESTEPEESTPPAETLPREYRELDASKAPTVKKVAWLPNELSSEHPTEEELTNFMFQAFVLYEKGTPRAGWAPFGATSADHYLLDPEYYRNKDYFYRVMSSYFKYASIYEMYADWELGNPLYENDIIALFSKFRGYPGDGYANYTDYAGINIENVVYEENRITFDLLYYYEEADLSNDPLYEAVVISSPQAMTYEDGLWKLNVTRVYRAGLVKEGTVYDTACKHLVPHPLYEAEDPIPALFDPKKINTKEKKAALPDYNGKLDPAKYVKPENGDVQYILKNRATAKTFNFTENTFSAKNPTGTDLANYLTQAFYFLSFTELSYGSIYGFPSVGKTVKIDGSSYDYLTLDPAYADAAKFAKIMNSYITGDWTGNSIYDFRDDKYYIVDPADGSIKVNSEWQFAKGHGIDHLFVDYDVLYEEQDTVILRVHFYAEDYGSLLQTFLCELDRGADGLWRINSEKINKLDPQFYAVESDLADYLEEHGASEFFKKGA